MNHPQPMVENLVIGGGLAGAMTGLRLAQAGREVVLLDRERKSHHKVCGEFLSPEAVDYLRLAGVDLSRLGAVAIEQLRLAARDRVVETALPFRALSLSRCVLDEALLACAEEAGCIVRRGVSAESLTQTNGAWTAEQSGRSLQCARNVFLATGKHDLRGWQRPHGKQGDLVGFKLHWQLAAQEIEALRGSMDLFLFAGGYGGLCLVEEDAANLCLVVRRKRLRQVGGWPQLLTALLTENRLVRQRLAGGRPVWERPLAISSIPYGYLAEPPLGLWRLGDQAAVIPSFTGDGMAIALHSGALAAGMHMGGKSSDQFQRVLSKQLRSGMSLAILLSRLMVSAVGQGMAPVALAALPQAMGWIARSTRIPETAVLLAQGWTTGA
ncbi:MAG TPA: FAD-dependent monooxygenase [Terracidiphilus sp.]|nr:FAD-dependent monooxygenase [Terracidiphilus sp.]